MVKNWIIVAVAAVAVMSSPQARAQEAVKPDDLEKALKTCMDHRDLKWMPGWEHCQVIADEMAARKKALEESQAFSAGIAEKLKGRMQK